LKVQLQKDNESKNKASQAFLEVENKIVDLKIQIEEAKRIEEEVRNQLKMKEENFEQLESEVVSLRKQLDKLWLKQTRILGTKNVETLNKILNSQNSTFDKSSLRYCNGANLHP
jgi:chromosome segregation ATPase